ncbi:hypothetical protein UFOVP996_19 [uncultured Caudovirales phage]|uniref:Bacteriophage lambda, Stf, side tail fibre-repeat-2 n=1 Tax=uncultured Caudovirales phage TaxID=2100421 RepID=A0A6J5Q2Q2_9CAUD|nr:hypothetical protein UFOVP996_19 [uncultured Caudovirales phage]
MPLILSGDAGITFPVVAGSASAVQASSGRVLQVVSTTLTTGFSTTSSSMVDVTGLSTSITPSSSSSKILITVNLSMTQGTGGVVIFYQMVRNSTAIGIGTTAGATISATGAMFTADAGNHAQNFVYPSSQLLDSPATTSATTYKVQICNNSSGTAVFINKRSDNYVSAISTITVMEIAA